MKPLKNNFDYKKVNYYPAKLVAPEAFRLFRQLSKLEDLHFNSPIKYQIESALKRIKKPEKLKAARLFVTRVISQTFDYYDRGTTNEPSSADFEKGLGRWTLAGNYGRELGLESLQRKLLTEGWHILPLTYIGSRTSSKPVKRKLEVILPKGETLNEILSNSEGLYKPSSLKAKEALEKNEPLVARDGFNDKFPTAVRRAIYLSQVSKKHRMKDA